MTALQKENSMLNLKHLVSALAMLSASTYCFALTPTMSAIVETPNQPVISGRTNLPDGTSLLITISRAASGYSAQTKVKVVKGAFRSERFSQRGADLNDGKYELEIMMPISQVQIPTVRAVIGKEGENLSGPLVSRGNLGKIVEYKSKFQAGRAANMKADHAARANEKIQRDQWVNDSCRDIIRQTRPSAALDSQQNAITNCIREVKSEKKR